MSTINKKPFIKEVIQDMSAQDILVLSTLVDGGGNQTALLRTVNNKPVGNRSHITSADKGVHLCSLEVNFSLFQGYLIYTNHYCVLIHFTDSQVLSMFRFDLNDLTQLETISEELSVLELRSELDDSTQSETVEIIDTVQNALDDGTIKIKANNPFPSNWPVNSTTKAFCDAVNADTTAVDGMVFLGELYCSDLPTGLVNVDTIVEIISGSGTSNKVIHLIATSGNVAPYRWEYTYWNSGSNVSGWKSFPVTDVQVDGQSALDGSIAKISIGPNLAPGYDSTLTYEIGDLCTHNGQLYECTTQISVAEEWNAAHWTAGSIAELVLGMINGEY